MTLAEYLYNYGFCVADANKIAAAYLSGGIEDAVACVAGWNDDQHDYTAELRWCIEDWVKLQSGGVDR